MKHMDKQIIRIIAAGLLPALLILFMPPELFALIREPDSIIYGSLRVDGGIRETGQIDLVLNGEDQPAVSYTLGDNPDADGQYIIRIPMDTISPEHPGTAREGDTADVFFNAVFIRQITVGQPGSVRCLNLDTAQEDTDGDGLSDAAEAVEGTNPDNPDTDGDGLTDNEELLAKTDPLRCDTDADGFSDWLERLAGTDPLESDSLPCVYVDGRNESGVEDGTREYPFTSITQGIQAVSDYFTVLVSPGVYTENVAIDKNISLVGETPADTVIKADDDAGAIGVDYTCCADSISRFMGFTIKDFDIGINLAGGASPVIRNNIITGVNQAGIKSQDSSSARIINNTIARNPDAVGLVANSPQLFVVNNIITGNRQGISCADSAPYLNYNNICANVSGDYAGACLAGTNDISLPPLFVDETNTDFHLAEGSACIDAGDPVAFLARDYEEGSSVYLETSLTLLTGDRIWMTDGLNTETDIVSDLTLEAFQTRIDINGSFVNDYMMMDSAYIYTTTSDCRQEPERLRIDMGAYGNTPEADGYVPIILPGDDDKDGDVDGGDLSNLAFGLFTTYDLEDLKKFAENFGKY
ncbi:right-handed parallel beta-helix repeat-containing protein [uncultured Desulfobacter sp.]|uniref:right-handed parallel beta-helix repeat-containing protein n=1 Tax=uncultured Desulfobacter sp. TaxID=240139 RepID=UPI0029F5C115|nr:right-handed parallel beta-helix repeat-containing protein [uncultured Desulfobacter sp.]